MLLSRGVFLGCVAVLVGRILWRGRPGDGRAEQQRGTTFAQELKKHNCRGQLGGWYVVEHLARLTPKDLAWRLSGAGQMRHFGRFHMRSHLTPGWRTRNLDVHVFEPGLDMQVQKLRAMDEPALALGRKGKQHVLEPTKRTLAVYGDQQPFAQSLVLHQTNEPFHPAVLLA